MTFARYLDSIPIASRDSNPSPSEIEFGLNRLDIIGIVCTHVIDPRGDRLTFEFGKLSL